MTTNIASVIKKTKQNDSKKDPYLDDSSPLETGTYLFHLVILCHSIYNTVFSRIRLAAVNQTVNHPCAARAVYTRIKQG